MTSRAYLFVAVGMVAAASALNCVGNAPTDSGNDTDASTAGDASTDTSSSSDGGGDASTDPCGGSINCPSRQNATHLQLWLRGDLGVDCNGGRVTTWHDQSGHHRDAVGASYPDGGNALAPQCGASTINGRSVVSFTDPSTGKPYVDEIFNVDLRFMADAAWTVIIVHRPLAAPGSEDQRGLLGAVRPAPPIVSCIADPPPENDGTLDIVFHSSDAGASLFYNAFPQCGPIESALYPRGVVTVDTLVFDGTDHAMYGDGTKVYDNNEGVDQIGVSADAGSLSPGVLGRDSHDGTTASADGRYAGDIAEVIIYDAALGSELTALAAYEKATWNAP